MDSVLTKKFGGTEPSVPPQPAESSGVEQRPEHPPVAETNPSMRTGSQSENNEEGTNQRDESDFPPLLNEIRLLQERLSYLENQAGQQRKAFIGNAPPKGKDSSQEPDEADLDSDQVLRKHIRKAPSGKQWAQRTEKNAEKESDERKDYGQDFGKVGIGLAKSSMYHIQSSGDLFDGDEYGAVTEPQGWVETHGMAALDLSHHEDSELRRRINPFPHRGIRPLTSMHPFYERPVRGIRPIKVEKHPLQLSRKLGPPTRWDDSDFEEWSSDTSTRSQDFKYFRSRLRGDFEWELDRLNAQVLRFQKHRNKKKSRQLATKAQKDNERRDEEFGAYHQHDELMTELGIDTKIAREDKHGIRQLSPMAWSVFRLRRALPLQYSFVIDILIEEPKLSNDLKPWGRFKGEKKDKRIQKASTNIRTPTAEDTNKKDDAAQSPKNLRPWTGQDPLPERIRINSREIIHMLSSIRGSPLCLDEDESSSVALLRPFRILNAYDKEIRDMCSKLRDGTPVEPPSSTAEAQDQEKEGTKSDIGLNKGRIEKPSEISGESTTGGDEQQPLSQEEQFRQLQHLDCLRKFMDEYIGRRVAYLNSVSCTKIFFSDVWHLFQPGTTVISAGGKQAYRVVSLRSKRHKGADRWDAFWDRRYGRKRGKPDDSDEQSDTRADITIQCVFIHFDGDSFGPVIRTFHMNKWDGDKEVTYLDIYPLRFHILKHVDKRLVPSSTNTPASVREQEVTDGVHALRRRLIDRGRVFLDVANVKQMYYSGLAVDTRDEIESQVMVDFEEALAHEARRDWIPKITRLVGTDWNPKADEADEGCTADCCWQENVHDDAYVETNNTEKFIDDMMADIKDKPHKLPSAIIFPKSLEETKTESNALTDDELMIMSHSVFGFVLRDRTWAKLDLDCMSTVRSTGDATEQTDDDLEEGGQGAFGQLVLPPGHKKMVLSLISQHFRNKGSQESNDKQVDIVRGKGKGLIILLHGAPGVGKTTTAEGVAETFAQPLFQITCGDLGSNPKDVEAALQTNFALANRWGCILLLDEADVFLAERGREDFNRNGLVAVFLRVLEYYAGILFLTTNRIGDFDEAFASRIHMSLHYPALDEVSTAKVFRLNLGLIKARLQDRVKIEEDEIITAAGKHWREHTQARWNGRQIRNACQTALALAEFDAQPKGKKYDIKEKSTAKIHLKLSHMMIVSNAYLEFTDYLNAVYGADAERRAKESGLRALDSLLDAFKSDKRQGHAGSRRSPSRGEDRTGHETSFQDLRLRPSSSGQRPAPRMASPSSPEPASRHVSGHQSAQRFAHEHASVPGHQIQYSQSAYTGNQSFTGSMRGGLRPSSQNVQSGSHLQAPQQGYGGVGRGNHGHYQGSDQYIQDDQPIQGYDVSYPSPPPSAARGGPAGGGASLGQFGDDQSRQGHRGGQVSYDESEQM